jgi:hypothetical protein
VVVVQTVLDHGIDADNHGTDGEKPTDCRKEKGKKQKHSFVTTNYSKTNETMARPTDPCPFVTIQSKELTAPAAARVAHLLVCWQSLLAVASIIGPDLPADGARDIFFQKIF